MISTIAGDGTNAFADGPALSAKFNAPVDVAVAADGTIYVADYLNHRIRKNCGRAGDHICRQRYSGHSKWQWAISALKEFRTVL